MAEGVPYLLMWLAVGNVSLVSSLDVSAGFSMNNRYDPARVEFYANNNAGNFAVVACSNEDATLFRQRDVAAEP